MHQYLTLLRKNFLAGCLLLSAFAYCSASDKIDHILKAQADSGILHLKFVMDYNKNCSEDFGDIPINTLWVGISGAPNMVGKGLKPDVNGELNILLPKTGTYGADLFYDSLLTTPISLHYIYKCNQGPMNAPGSYTILYANIASSGISVGLDGSFLGVPLCFSDTLKIITTFVDGDIHPASSSTGSYAIVLDYTNGDKDSTVITVALKGHDDHYRYDVKKVVTKPGWYRPTLTFYSLQGTKRKSSPLQFHDSVFYWDTCVNVSGKLFVDKNQNCKFDSGEKPLRGVTLKAVNSNIASYVNTDINGDYTLRWPKNTTGLIGVASSKTGLPESSPCLNDGLVLNNVKAGTLGNDLPVSCEGKEELEPFYYGRTSMRPAAIEEISFDISNLFCRNFDATFTVTLPDGFKYHSDAKGSAATYISPKKDVVKFRTVLSPSGAKHVSANRIAFFVEVDTFVNIGQIKEISYVIHPDTTTVKDTSKLKGKVIIEIVNSYDPNDKQVSPKGDVDSFAKDFVYTVRFQNTGNAEALNIYILDTLDQNLDINTLKVITSSHPMKLYFMENRVMRFDFKNINLPDSGSDQEGSNGYVTYAVTRKNDLKIGDSWKNTAYIYFDFNPPIITNTVTNRLVDVKASARKIAGVTNLSAWPNPTENILNLSCDDIIHEITISDISGRILRTAQVNEKNVRISLEDLSAGNYFVTVKSEKGVSTVRVVKE